jgi:hypothetical protein
MPEMLAYCGRKMRVLRHAEKSCVEFSGGISKIRQFRKNDVVILEGLRCSGVNHDGCQRACLLFWKEAWLQKLDTAACASASFPPDGSGQMSLKLKSKAGANRYFCQSTELASATKALPRSGIVAKCWRDVRSGNRGVFEMMRLVAVPLWRKATRSFSRRLTGILKRTPAGSLNLQPGEWVEIKSEAEITQTLDLQGRNRGLVCDRNMSQYGGGRYRVRNRLGRMILESSGEMRQVESTVILEGSECKCWDVFGGCPRQEFIYWREIWLKRINGNPPPGHASKM